MAVNNGWRVVLISASWPASHIIEPDEYRGEAVIVRVDAIHNGSSRGIGISLLEELRSTRPVIVYRPHRRIPGTRGEEQSAERSDRTGRGKNVRDDELPGHSMHREKIGQILPRKLFVANHPGLYAC